MLDPVPSREPVIFREPLLLTPVWVRWLQQFATDTQQRLRDLELEIAALQPELVAWTPTLVGTTGGSAHTYAVQLGVARRVKQWWTIAATIELSAEDATMGGTVTIGGLPAAIQGPTGLFIPLTMGFSNVALTGQFTGVVAVLVPGETALRLYQVGANTGWGLLPAGAITATTLLAVSGSYFSSAEVSSGP